MNWHSWGEFWAMGGHAVFVWSSYGLFFVLVLAELISLRGHRHQVERQLQAWLRNQEEKEVT